MADWQAFATSFLTGVASDINERKDKAEDYEDKQRELADKNKAIMSKRKEIVGRYTGLANQAKTLGASDEMISAALSSGPQGLVDLTSNLQSVKTSMGSRWTPEAAKNAVELPKNFQMPDMNINEQIQATFGLPEAKVGSTTAGEVSWLDKALGRKGKERVRAELDSEAYSDGYSILDINEVAQQSEYQSLSGGSFVNFTMPKVFDPEDATAESVNINRMMDQAKDSVAYKQMEAEYDALEAKDTLKGSAEDSAKIARMQELQQGMLETQRSFVSDYVNSRAGIYTGGGYIESMGSIIDGFLGTGSAAAMVASAGENTTGVSADAIAPVAQRSATVAEVAPQVEQAGGTVDVSPDAMVTMTHESLPYDGGKVAFETNEDGLPVTATFGVDGEEYVTDDAGVIEQLWTSVTSITPKTAGPMLTPDEWVTEEQSDAMTKKELQGMGLKGSPLGKLIQFLPSEELKARAIEQIKLKRDADPEAYYKVVISGRNLNRPVKVKGSDLFFIPDADLVRGNNNVTISELGIDEDLPKRTYSQNKIKRIFNSEGADPGLSVEGLAEQQDAPDGSVRPKMRPDGLGAKPQEAPAEEEATPVSADQEAVIKTYGRDIIKYMQESGFTGDETEEELAEGLADWYAENAEKLDIPSYPRDQGPIIYVIKRFLKES